MSEGFVFAFVSHCCHRQSSSHRGFSPFRPTGWREGVFFQRPSNWTRYDEVVTFLLRVSLQEIRVSSSLGGDPFSRSRPAYVYCKCIARVVTEFKKTTTKNCFRRIGLLPRGCRKF